jgi:hypothetical protein
VLKSDLAPERQTVEMREHLLDIHDVGVFVMQIEQVDLVAERRAVVGAFLDHHVVEAVGIGIHRRGAHTARGAFAADDQAVDPLLLQMGDERRPKKGRRAFLVDHEVAGRGGELRLDVVGVVGLAAHVAVGGMHAAGVDAAGGVDDGHPRAPRCREQRQRRCHRPPGVLSAGAGEFAVDLFHRAVAAAIGLVVEIDGEHRRVVPDIDPAAVSLVDLDRIGVDDVLPAMVLEIARHDVGLLLKLANSE